MTEQERELFERRTVELAQARRVIDDLRARYTDVSKALSHVLHDNASLEAERDRLMSIADAVERANLAKHKRIAELEHDYSAALNAQEAAEKEVFALRAKVSELEANYSLLATGSRGPATPGVDESGEPAAYDVADKHWPAVGERTTEDVAWDHCMACPEARYVFTSPWSRERFPVKAGKHPRTGNPCLLNDPPESRSSPSFTSVRGDNNSAWVAERAPDAAPADTRPPGERVKVGDRVRFKWFGGTDRGLVQTLIAGDWLGGWVSIVDCSADKAGVVVHADSILEILPEAP